MASDEASAAHRLWTLVEPCHAVIYFAAEVRPAFEAVGLRGFWRGYFAGRAAPLGPVGPGVVTACFYGFHPDFVARALPSIWSIAPPAKALEARLAGVDAALRGLLAASGRRSDLAEAAELLRRAVDGCGSAGRPLYAANAELPWPSEPHLALWHAATLLREHRGDGHVAALNVAGLDPCEAHVLRIAVSGGAPATIQPYRGWSDDDWSGAARRLRARGWLDDNGGATPEGRARREAVEDDTNRLAAGPVRQLGPERLERLLRLLHSLVETLIGAGAISYPNPIGLPRPTGAASGEHA